MEIVVQGDAAATPLTLPLPPLLLLMLLAAPPEPPREKEGESGGSVAAAAEATRETGASAAAAADEDRDDVDDEAAAAEEEKGETHLRGEGGVDGGQSARRRLSLTSTGTPFSFRPLRSLQPVKPCAWQATRTLAIPTLDGLKRSKE